MLAAIVDRSTAALLSLTLMLAVTAATVPLLGEEFLPNFASTILMHWVEKPGTSLEAIRRVTVSASKELIAIPGVRNSVRILEAEVADGVVGPNFTSWIDWTRPLTTTRRSRRLVRSGRLSRARSRSVHVSAQAP